MASSLTYFPVSGDFYNVSDPSISDTTNVPEVQIIEGLVTFYPRLPVGFVAFIEDYLLSGAITEVQVLTLVGAISGTFTLSYQGQTTAALPYNAAATTIQTALRGLSTIGAGNVNVTGSAGGPYTITFAGTLANNVADLIGVDASGLGGVAPTINVATTVTGQPALNETQTITITGGPTSGTYTITFGGYTTTPIPYNATAAVVQAAIQALRSVGTNNATVVGVGGGPYTVTFGGALAGGNLPQMTAVSSLGGGTTPGVTIATTQNGQPLVNEVQTVTIANALGGTFTLTFGTRTTVALPWNSMWFVIQQALAALTSVGVNNVAVKGPVNGTYTITFMGTLAGTDVGQITANGTALVGAQPIATVGRTTTGTAQVARDTAIAIPPRKGRIWNGQLSTIDIVDTPGVELVANSAILDLSARGFPSLIYDVKFSDVTYSKGSQKIENFAFTAPTDATPVCITDPALTRLSYGGPP